MTVGIMYPPPRYEHSILKLKSNNIKKLLYYLESFHGVAKNLDKFNNILTEIPILGYTYIDDPSLTSNQRKRLQQVTTLCLQQRPMLQISYSRIAKCAARAIPCIVT